MKFGILCNGDSLQKWQLDSVKCLLAEGHECVVYVQNGNEFQKKSFFDRLKSFPWRHGLYRFWFRYLLKPDAKNMLPLSALKCNAKVLSCKTIKKGFSEYFNLSDIETINSFQLDFILRYGFSILKGEILSAAKYGVWSYHHDDEQKYRGVPTGFWEILFSDPVNAAILQRLTPSIDNGKILYKAHFSTISHSWEANLQNILIQSVEWPMLVCRKLENDGDSFQEMEIRPETPIFKAPKNAIMLKFFFKLWRNKITFHLADLFRFENWQIGIINQDVSSFIDEGVVPIPEIQWIPRSNKRSSYQADPFGFVNEEGLHVLSESYDYKTQKGIIISQLIDIETNNVIREVNALVKPYHLAYPYLFSFDDNWFCLPENSEGNSVDLYKYDSSSGKLLFFRTLISDIQAVDATLFFYNSLWWLFFTDRQSTNERLHIWYSSSLVSDFEPHALNPVKTDIRSSRPAGALFYHKGKVLRPTQDCSIRSGRQIVINELLILTQTDFKEKTYATIAPPSHKEMKGIHTFCVNDGMVIVDCKKEVFVFQAFVIKLKGKMNKLFGINKP